MGAEVNETSPQSATHTLFLSSRWGRQLPWVTQNATSEAIFQMRMGTPK
jgi:hypothetical protein